MRPSFSRRLLLLLLAVATQATTDLTQYVLPSTGENGGNTFPGVSLPFGMVKLGPDVYTGADSYSGFASSGVFTGFSMMHETGTGGAPKYGVVSQLPVTGNIINPLDGLNDSRAAPDVTTVGYYKSSLGSNITVELAATPRAGFYQYTFPRRKYIDNRRPLRRIWRLQQWVESCSGLEDLLLWLFQQHCFCQNFQQPERYYKHTGWL